MTGAWGTSQHAVFSNGDELIENYLVLGEDGTEHRYFRLEETFGSVTDTSTTTCAKGRYVLDADASLTSDLVITTSSVTSNVVPPPQQESHEVATARLVGPQLRVERTDQGDRGTVIVYDRLDVPSDLEGSCL